MPTEQVILNVVADGTVWHLDGGELARVNLRGGVVRFAAPEHPDHATAEANVAEGGYYRLPDGTAWRNIPPLKRAVRVNATAFRVGRPQLGAVPTAVGWWSLGDGWVLQISADRYRWYPVVAMPDAATALERLAILDVYRLPDGTFWQVRPQ